MAGFFCKTCDAQSENDIYEGVLRNIVDHFDSFYDIENHFDMGWSIYDDRGADEALRFLFKHVGEGHEISIVGFGITAIPIKLVF